MPYSASVAEAERRTPTGVEEAVTVSNNSVTAGNGTNGWQDKATGARTHARTARGYSDRDVHARARGEIGVRQRSSSPR